MRHIHVVGSSHFQAAERLVDAVRFLGRSEEIRVLEGPPDQELGEHDVLVATVSAHHRRRPELLALAGAGVVVWTSRVQQSRAFVNRWFVEDILSDRRREFFINKPEEGADGIPWDVWLRFVLAGREEREEVTGRIIGFSRATHRVRDQVLRSGRLPDRRTILLTGPTGSGKSVVATTLAVLWRLHRGGSGEPLPVLSHVSASTFSPQELEDALCGHQRASYTGAADPRPAMLAEAHLRPVFVDEVRGETLKAVVGFLLPILSDGKYLVRGATKPTDVPEGAKIIIASSELGDHLSRQEGSELERRGTVISLAPLTERDEDKAPLRDVFWHLAVDARRSREPDLGKLRMTDELKTRVEQYPWPANNGQMQKVLGEIVDRAMTSLVGLEYWPPELVAERASDPVGRPGRAATPTSDPTDVGVQAFVDSCRREGWTSTQDLFSAYTDRCLTHGQPSLQDVNRFARALGKLDLKNQPRTNSRGWVLTMTGDDGTR